MTNQSQTDPTALQGPQKRVQRTVEWIATDPKATRVAKAVVGIVRFDVTIRRVDGAEIDAGLLAAPLRAGERDGKLQVEPLDLRAAFAEALDAAENL